MTLPISTTTSAAKSSSLRTPVITFDAILVDVCDFDCVDVRLFVKTVPVDDLKYLLRRYPVASTPIDVRYSHTSLPSLPALSCYIFQAFFAAFGVDEFCAMCFIIGVNYARPFDKSTLSFDKLIILMCPQVLFSSALSPGPSSEDEIVILARQALMSKSGSPVFDSNIIGNAPFSNCRTSQI